MSWRFLAQNNLKCSEGKGHTFESCRVRQSWLGPVTRLDSLLAFASPAHRSAAHSLPALLNIPGEHSDRRVPPSQQP